ncbi:hypothetical protein BO71DRAFT_436114 [Aspergillus ellipticus CBS 707.79]|uniref:Uncharacterized protein n=1 Tax=Aspergillus ellipticus CBS 707.79 TaxID=1448320 RepID=A0A319CU39_9EURO|nr:hypothetical protein BO71DRAFT_436114 [Aspergillus ellipticus CBS 707.79]
MGLAQGVARLVGGMLRAHSSAVFGAAVSSPYLGCKLNGSQSADPLQLLLSGLLTQARPVPVACRAAVRIGSANQRLFRGRQPPQHAPRLQSAARRPWQWDGSCCLQALKQASTTLGPEGNVGQWPGGQIMDDGIECAAAPLRMSQWGRLGPEPGIGI